MPFRYIYYKKAKHVAFTKKYPSQKIGKNVQGNVIHIAHMLSSIENKEF